MFRNMLRSIRLTRFKLVWRKKNKHNSTTVERVFPLENVSVGRNTYGPLNIFWMAPNDATLTIGNYCSIGPKVTFLVGGEHNYKRISTYPFQSLVYQQKTEGKINRNIIVEDDVWIGYDALILSGVKIGKGSVIGARSIVTKDVPPYSIYVGNRILRKRFSDDIINKIISIDYSSIDHQINDSYQSYCQSELTYNNVDEIVSQFIKS